MFPSEFQLKKFFKCTLIPTFNCRYSAGKKVLQITRHHLFVKSLFDSVLHITTELLKQLRLTVKINITKLRYVN